MLSAIVSVATFISAAELGGLVLDSRSGKAFPSPVPVKVSLYADEGLCISETLADVSGGYSLEAPPGQYWVRVVVGKDEVLSERLTLGSVSTFRSLRVSSPWAESNEPPRILARRSYPEGSVLNMR
jgi:hypothetical protein